jgi:DNA-binding MarR family transcriptional regulator
VAARPPVRIQKKQTKPPEAGIFLEQVLLEILGSFFELRTAGQVLELVTEWGAGSWGLMRLLKADGPKTMPEIARMRSVSRQYIQKLANEVIDRGWLTLIDNPGHRRSKMLQLTKSGERQLAVMSERLAAHVDQIAGDFAESELRITIETLRRVRRALKAKIAIRSGGERTADTCAQN